MLTKRIIPCLDVKNGSVVKGVRFKNHEVVGSILDLAKKYNDEGADELVFYDIGASTYDGTVSKEWVKLIAEVINIPFCVAGGIKSIDDAKEILNSGADKISIHSPAIQRPNLIRELADEFGSQCVVVGIDSKTVKDKFIVFSNTGDENTIINTELETKEWIDTIQELGAGEILLTSMDKDGTKSGFDNELLNKSTTKISIPVMAAGGVGTLEHMYEGVVEGGASALLAASIFHFGEYRIQDVKRYLADKKIPVSI